MKNLTEIKKLFDSANTLQCDIQFGKKSFWYGEWQKVDNVYVRILQSYGTKVGIEIEENNESILYEIGKYSTTTSKQITQFYNQLSLANNRVYIEPDFEWTSKYAGGGR